MKDVLKRKPPNPTTREWSRDRQEMLSTVKSAPVKIGIGLRGQKRPGWLAVDAYDTNPQIDFKWDIHRLPIADNSVDAYICSAILEHVPYPELALFEMFRTLRPGGRVLVEVPFLYHYHPAPLDLYRWTVEGLKILCEDFEILSAGVGVKSSYLAYYLLDHMYRVTKMNLEDATLSKIIDAMSAYDEAVKDHPVYYAISYVSAKRGAAAAAEEKYRYFDWKRTRYAVEKGLTYDIDARVTAEEMARRAAVPE